MIKTIIHVPAGEFKNKQGLFECGPFEPPLPILSVSPEGVTTYDPDYAIVVVPRMPDPRIEKWNGSAIVAKTQAELDAYDAKQPKIVKTRDLLRRITTAEHDAIEELGKTNKTLKRLMRLMLADGTTDVNHPEFIQGWAYIKTIGIPSIWLDEATADAAIARIRRGTA